MTVKELIEALQKFHPESGVQCPNWGSGVYDDLSSLHYNVSVDVVFLDT